MWIMRIDVVEGAQPIMEYVRRLEDRCRRYEKAERKFNFGCFLAGVLFGGGIVSLAWLALVLVKLKGGS